MDGHANLAYGTVLTAPSPAISGLSLTLQTGQGSIFPTAPFNATVWPVGIAPLTSNAEIIRVTAKAGDVFTIVRQAPGEGSGARTIVVGDQVVCALTKKGLTDLEPDEVSTASTGNIDNYDPGVTCGVISLRCTGAAPVIRGVVNGFKGQTILIHCLGTTLKVAHQDAGSTAANRIICESTQGQIVGVGGIIGLVYDATTARWRAYLLNQGNWIDVAFSAGNFTASGSMTWTVASGDQTLFRYKQRGTMLSLILDLQTTTVGGTPATDLKVTTPFTMATTTTGAHYQGAGRDNNASPELLQLKTTAASAILTFVRNAGGNWTASTDLTAITANLALDIQ